MNHGIISLGSNVPDKKRILLHAITALGVNVIEATPPYMDPEDNDNRKPYLNIVALIETTMDFDSLLDSFKKQETEAGRTPAGKISGEIPLDIDIVVFNDNIIRPEDYRRPYFTRGYRMLRNTRP